MTDSHINALHRKYGEAEALQAQEAIATKLETQQFNCFHVSVEDFSRLEALPVGTKLYAAPQPPAPCTKRPYNGRAMSVQDHNEIVDALLAKVAEQNAEIAQLKTVPMKYRRMEFNAQLQAKVSEQSAEIDRLKVCADDEREIRQRVERVAAAGREQQSESIAELEETREAIWETQRALWNQVYERDMLIERCRDALSMPCDHWNKRQSLIVNDVLEAIDAIVAHKKGGSE